MNLDDKDRIIISKYSENPDVSQDEIAREIELSQPSVAVRVRKLKKAGAIQTHTGINPLEMGLYVAKVDIAANDTVKILEMFKSCPYFAQGFTVSGKYNLCLFFMGENIATLESIINAHIRSDDSVRELDFNIIITSERDFIVPTILTQSITKKPPCGISQQCKNCPPFKAKKCMGCPATGQYQGWFY